MARATCTRNQKPRFPNKLECDLAIAAIHLTNVHHRHRKSREEPTRSYECEFCSGWHMTSQPERKLLTCR